jgi:Zn-dependent M28 family amino/carboxypeptidase
VIYQSYLVEGIEYKNVIGSINTHNNERIIVGAHYDVCEEQEGADDNGSGIAGLLEIARLLSTEKLPHRIDFVAYTLEEPPFFRTEQMGSYIHAKYLFDNKIPVTGMVCLEMIGYYSDEEDSQEYPFGLLKYFYGNRGNFITIVQKWGNSDFGSDLKDKMKELNIIETKSFSGPTFIPGLDFSDHLNYWKFDFSAVMVTNTAFYRNKNYHQSSDTMETLDINRMSLVIDELFLSLKEISSSYKGN